MSIQAALILGAGFFSAGVAAGVWWSDWSYRNLLADIDAKLAMLEARISGEEV